MVAQTSHSPMGLHGLLQRWLYLFIEIIVTTIIRQSITKGHCRGKLTIRNKVKETTKDTIYMLKTAGSRNQETKNELCAKAMELGRSPL
jgi:hypothetical protein